MIRYITLAALTVLATSASAQTLEKPSCTEATIASIDEKVFRMKDSPQKRTASNEIAAARAALKTGGIAVCQDHLLKANVQTK